MQTDRKAINELASLDDMNINLKFYRNFVEIVEAGTLSQASQKTNTTQTTLTMEMKVLENKLGAKLLVRNKGRRQLELTDIGQAFYQRARDLCYLFNNIHEEMSSIIEGSTGILRLSVSASRAQSVCRDLLIPFHEQNPLVRFEVLEGILPKLETNVLTSLTELAISNSPLQNREQFEIVHRLPEKVYAIFRPERFSFTDKDSLSLADLAHQPVSLPKGSSTIFLDSMTASGYTINCLAKSSSRSTALSWAEAGAAIAIIPRDEFDAEIPGLKYLPIDDNRFYTEKIVFKLAGKPLSPLAQRFLDFYLESYRNKKVPMG